MSAPRRKIGFLSIPENRLSSAMLAKEAVARARVEIATAPRRHELQALVDVYRAELEVMRQAPTAVLIAGLRKIIGEADKACGASVDHADRLAALFAIRHTALDSLFAAKVRERGVDEAKGTA